MQKSINEAIGDYLQSVALARSANTARAYGNGLQAFAKALEANGIDPHQVDITEITEDCITWMADDLKALATSTEQLYMTATVGFYEYLEASRMATPNLSRVRLLAKMHQRRTGRRLANYPRREVERLLEYAETLGGDLRALRDRALLLTLADTGLRIHEACKLLRGDIDHEKRRAVIIGKGDKEAVIRFSSRALEAIRAYLAAREDPESNRERMPVFTRHDYAAGAVMTPITPEGGRHIIHARATEAMGDHTLTPHTLRHHFVTTVYRRTGGNLAVAKELARHTNVQTTMQYTHLEPGELDDNYARIFETWR